MRRAWVAVGLVALGCGPASPSNGTSATTEHLTPSRVVLTQAQFTPAPNRPSWLSGFSADDFWFAPSTGGVLRSRHQGLPMRVAELEPSRIGGPLANPIFLSSGDAFFTVLLANGSQKLVHWKDGSVEDLTVALAGSGTAFERVADLRRTPSGEMVALIHAATDSRHLTFVSWDGRALATGPAFDVPSDLVTWQAVAVSSTQALLLGADRSGLYRMARFDGHALSAAVSLPGQMGSPLMPTGPDAAFIAVDGMRFWDGKALSPLSAPPDSPVYLAFAPDGLASVESDGGATGYANPRVVIEHASGGITRFSVGDAGTASSRHWLAAGIAGTTLLVMVDGTAAADPSVVAVDLRP